MPWEEHLVRITTCDLVLDTLVYGAHTTASDVLWMWVPILSLETYSTHRMPSRVSGSIIATLPQSSTDSTTRTSDVLASISPLAAERGWSVTDIMVLHTTKELENVAVR